MRPATRHALRGNRREPGAAGLNFSFYTNEGTSADALRNASVSNVTNYFKSGGGDDAATADKSGYSSGAASCLGIKKIEVFA